MAIQYVSSDVDDAFVRWCEDQDREPDGDAWDDYDDLMRSATAEDFG